MNFIRMVCLVAVLGAVFDAAAENMAVAGYGGKASGPLGLKAPKDINMKGAFKIYRANGAGRLFFATCRTDGTKLDWFQYE